MGRAPEQAVIEFLRRRYASAIAAGDDRTAMRLRGELDRLMNDRRRRSGYRFDPSFPSCRPQPELIQGQIGADSADPDFLYAPPPEIRPEGGGS